MEQVDIAVWSECECVKSVTCVRVWSGCMLECGCGVGASWSEAVEWVHVGVRVWSGCMLECGCGVCVWV